ncbi:MAG TPA: hypothetical protein VEF90_09840, partial [Xanthobacteraceae bacterium]|nr:hypothetical protein [Xanthobacteraceae bacterium]
MNRHAPSIRRQQRAHRFTEEEIYEDGGTISIRVNGDDKRDNMTFFQAASRDAGASSIVTRFNAFERTKLYDLLAASPLIAWYGFALSIQLPRIARKIASLDPATVDARALAGLASNLATQIFFIVLILLMVLRHRPLGKASGFYPRFVAVAGTFLSIAIVVLPARELP